MIFKKKCVVALLVVTTLIASGCASMARFDGYQHSYPNSTPQIYPATYMDIDAMLILGPLPLLDMPFSILIDTIFLPYDCYAGWKKKRTRYHIDMESPSATANDLVNRGAKATK